MIFIRSIFISKVKTTEKVAVLFVWNYFLCVWEMQTVELSTYHKKVAILIYLAHYLKRAYYINNLNWPRTVMRGGNQIKCNVVMNDACPLALIFNGFRFQDSSLSCHLSLTFTSFLWAFKLRLFTRYHIYLSDRIIALKLKIMWYLLVGIFVLRTQIYLKAVNLFK